MKKDKKKSVAFQPHAFFVEFEKARPPVYVAIGRQHYQQTSVLTTSVEPGQDAFYLIHFGTIVSLFEHVVI